MATYTLADIRTKVRQVTGRLTDGEMSNVILDQYINRYYQLTFPAELKLDRKLTYYEFLTSENTTWYDLPEDTFTNIEPPATIDELEMLWYQSSAAFFDQNPLTIQRQIPWTGDGSTVSFSTTLASPPIMPDSLVITDETETFEDTNKTWSTTTQNITGDLGGTGTVNYNTGAIAVSFFTAPANGQDITLSFVKMSVGRPIAVLMYNNQFQFFPTPDTAYRFRAQAYSVVSALTNATDRPDLDQWGPCIAYGASRDIVADNGEMDAYQEITILYKEQLAYVLKRTNQNLLNTRAQPNF
ncbi:MAG: hypothetical protein K1000chlam2_00014 [Chlamydiae bacterium]|nr:hypothetical protein [Chlamydiota bacterium]